MRTIVKVCLLFAVFSFGSLFLMEAPAIGGVQERDFEDGSPILSSFEMYQLGSSEIVLGFDGESLPAPVLTFKGNHLKLVFLKTRLEAADFVDYAKLVPLVSSAKVRSVSEDVEINIFSDGPLKVRSTRGAPPARSFMIRLVTDEGRERIQRDVKIQKRVYKPVTTMGPFAVKTPVTLDLRDTELRDVFRMLGSYLKKNIIIDPSMPPALVTMTLKNVPLSEAFSYLMKTYDLSYYTMGKDTIIVGTNDGLSKVAGTEETRVFHVAYAEPAALQSLLITLANMQPDRVVVDARMHSLYVTSNPSKLKEVAALVQKLDRPGKQVMIHAKILEFTDSAKKEVEKALNTVYNHWWFSYSGSGGGKVGFIDDNWIGRNLVIPEGALKPTMTELFTPMQGVWREFDVAFRAMENKGQGKTLANPSVVTLDGVESSVSLTEDFPYISGRDEAGNPSWATQTVGPQLGILPKIGRDGTVTLKLSIATGEVLEMVTGSTGEQMPKTSTRKVETTVRVRNGEPFVVGGLFRENNVNSVGRIPVLGQLPLLGELFTYRSKDKRKSQVVVVVVPYILETPDVEVEQETVSIRN